MRFYQLLQLVTLGSALMLSTASFAATPMPSDGLQTQHAVAAQPVDAPATSAAKEAAQPKIDPNIKASAVGRVVWVKGAFKAISIGNETRELDKASIIYEHDVLITGDNTKAQIVFTDNSLMTFNPNTRFVVENYEFNDKKKGGAGKYFMRLIEGGFRTITGYIASSDPDSYQVNTPVATIGVRGTDYAVYLKNGELFIGYYKGTPCVSNAEKRLCLNNRNRFAKVPDSNSQPETVKEKPAVFEEKLDVVPASIAPSSSSDSDFGYLSTDDSAATAAASDSSSSGSSSDSSGDTSSSSTSSSSSDTSSSSSSGTSSSDTSSTGTSSTGTSSSSGTSTSGTSTSGTSSSTTSNSFTVQGTSSTGTSSNSLTITNTEIQVTAPPAPSGGTVSSFCIVN